MKEFLQKAGEAFTSLFTEKLSALITFLLVLILGFLVVRLLLRIARRTVKRSKMHAAAGDFLLSLIKVLLFAIYLIALLSLLGVPTTSLIALLSAFALAVSLALQNTFSNVAAGFVLVTTKPFEENDHVLIVTGNGEAEGIVETITVFNTKLLTFQNEEITLPNGAVMASNITNYTAKEIRRLNITFKAPFEVDSEKVRETVLALAATHKEEVLNDPAPTMKVTGYEPHAQIYSLRVWCKQDAYWDLCYALHEELPGALAAQGISIALPKMDVHIKQ